MKALGVALAVSLAVLFTAGEGRAGYMDGQRLNEGCAAGLASYNEGVCLGYVQGVYDAGKVLDAATDKRQWVDGWTACVPDTVKTGQLKAVVMKWLREHPEGWHYTGNSQVARAFAETWPCR